MLLCVKFLDAGYQVAYVAEAEVVHSHNHSMGDLFSRYFRIGTFAVAQQKALRCESNSGEGFAFVREQIAFLRRTRRSDAIPRAIVETGIKALGYQLGKVIGSRFH